MRQSDKLCRKFAFVQRDAARAQSPLPFFFHYNGCIVFCKDRDIEKFVRVYPPDRFAVRRAAPSILFRKFCHALNGVCTHGAGVQTHDGQRSIAHEEHAFFEQLEVFQHFQENDVFCEQNVVEGLYVLVAVLDGNAVAEANCLCLAVAEPLSSFHR